MIGNNLLQFRVNNYRVAFLTYFDIIVLSFTAVRITYNDISVVKIIFEKYLRQILNTIIISLNSNIILFDIIYSDPLVTYCTTE